jgi:arylsulfatase A-like enzyme
MSGAGASIRAVILAGLAMLSAGTVACKSTTAGTGSTMPPDFSILVIVLDACRADKIGVYGFGRETSPTIDALARDPDAVVFRRHYVQGTWTKPSTASLFTGRFVHRHGVTMPHEEAAGKAGRPRPPAKPGQAHLFRTQVLPPSLHTMAEWLRDSGFETFGVVKSQHLVPDYGFARGFRNYYSPNDGPSEDGRLASKFVEWLDQYPARAFGYLHVNACHFPFPVRYRDPEYMNRYGYPYDERARQRVGVDFANPDIKFQIRDGTLTLSDDDVRFLNLVYEAKLRWTDRNTVDPLMKTLRTHHRYDNSLIIVTADHGEELYDHQGYGHGPSVWDAVVHVPLIVKFPKGHKPPTLPHDVTAVSGNVDLLPSILHVLGIAPPTELSGRRIFEAVNGGSILTEQGTNSGEIVEWGLRLDLAAAEPERVQAMRTAAGALRGATVAAPIVDTQLSPAAVEQLRALGYLEPKQ